jgi:hypothetical protein
MSISIGGERAPLLRLVGRQAALALEDHVLSLLRQKMAQSSRNRNRIEFGLKILF